MLNYLALEKLNGGRNAEKQVIELIGAVSFSTGDGLELTSRYGYDASRLPQSLTRRKRNTALTATANLVFSPTLCASKGVSIMDYISTLEGIVGAKITLYWQGREKGGFVVRSAQFSTGIDPYTIFSEVSVGLSFTEGYIANPQPWNAVRV